MIAVNVDASYREDLERGGIAYCGALGRATQCVNARNTMHAELLALVFAMTAAHVQEVEDVTFRHDAEVKLRGPRRSGPSYGVLEDVRAVLRAMLDEHPGWQLKQIRRGRNVEANILARRALKLEVGSPAAKAHCVEAAEREAARRSA